MNREDFYDDLRKLVEVLPPMIIQQIDQIELETLVEIVLDLGRPLEVRYLDGHIEYLGENLVEKDDLRYITEIIDDFTSDNRSGIPGTLHRISAIRNRKSEVIGLTCRVGRVVTGTINCIKDLVKQEKSILFLGRPGVGKTTKLREIAWLLANDIKKRVIVIDTSNEIAGDGNIPHKAIGRARRMQVASPDRQKDVMIEAVENHTPEVIVVDEIGTEAEALAARTIAERGVMLVSTAHGNTLENLIKNPTLSDLVGGVSSVTLGDDEARRRATQKTVLEREKKPTFDIVIEIIDRETLAVYSDVSDAVDYLLRSWPIQPEVRKVGSTKVIQPAVTPAVVVSQGPSYKIHKQMSMDKMDFAYNLDKYIKENKTHKKIYIYAVSRSIIDKVIERLDLDAEVTRNVDEADFVITHKSYAKGGAKIINVAKEYQIPLYYVKSNTMPQIQKVIKEALNLTAQPGDKVNVAYFDETEIALQEAKMAINQVLSGITTVDLKPRRSQIRKLQHELIEQCNLFSKSLGEEPERYIKICSKDHEGLIAG